MPLAQRHLEIPTKDIISWCHDNRHAFDQDKPIYIDTANPSQSISANQAYTLIRKLVAGFRAAGLEKGDVVCIHAFNNLYYPILVQGIVGCGGTFVGLSPAYTSYELAHALKTSKAKFVITEQEQDILASMQEPAQSRGIPDKNILLFVEPSGIKPIQVHKSWRSLLQHGEQDWVKFDDLETAKRTPAFLMFSSGTTGLPKAAIQSHYNIIAQHTLIHEDPQHPEPYHMSRMACLPMFHTAIAEYTHTTTLRSGRESYIMKRFQLDEFLKYTRDFKVTSIIIVPPMVVAITNYATQSPEKEAYVRGCLSWTKSIVGGAAPLDPETQGKLQRLLPGGSAFTQLWAMTETTCIASWFFYPENDDTGSVGKFVSNIDVKVVDPETGTEIGPYDVEGELCVRGPTVIRGYLNNSEANARDWDEDEYFHTGDIVTCSSKTGLWYVVDRSKELIKVRGFQVAPNEIEGVLLSHPAISDAAVIGIPDASSGSEKPRAYIVRAASQDGKTLDEEEVKTWVKDRLAGYKRLEGGVKFVGSIPKTASGKILKRVLREEAKKEDGRDSKL